MGVDGEGEWSCEEVVLERREGAWAKRGRSRRVERARGDWDIEKTCWGELLVSSLGWVK